MKRRFGHYETIAYDLRAVAAPVLPLPAARPNYTAQNEELARLEYAASFGSQLCIGLCIGFVLCAAAFW